MKAEATFEGVLQRVDLGVGVWVLDHPTLGRVQLSFRPGAAPGRALDGARVAVVGALSGELMGIGMAGSRSLTVESLRPLG
jgi:hypothetical protein